MKRYATVLSLAAAVLACAVFILKDRSAATTDELEARRRNLFPAFHRDRVDAVDVTGPHGAWTLRRQGDAWLVVSNGSSRSADPVEAERMLSEVEGAEPTRRVGGLDGAARTRFGLATPRARVVVHQGDRVSAAFSVGGAVPGEDATYVEADGAGAVLARSFGEAFDRAATDLRDKTIAEMDPSRIDAIVITMGTTVKRLARRGPVWRVVEPDLGRAARGAVDAVTSELHTLSATRWLDDAPTEATLARYGLGQTAVRVEISRGTASPVVLRFGGACPGHDGEVVGVREGAAAVFCVGRVLPDAVRVPAEGFQDDHLVASRTDEISTVHVHGPGTADVTLQRTGDGWRSEGSTNPVDTEAVESWLNTLHDMAAASRRTGDARASHGLTTPAVTLEIGRTGVEGTERIAVGTSDATGVYVARDDEALVLQFPPSASETLVVESVRFRPRRLIHDEEGDLQAVLLDVGAQHEELARVDGGWHLGRPVLAAADPGAMRDLARTLASLEADRWVASVVRPEHGMAVPRAHVVARFEGPGLHEEDADGGSDGGATRVRTYTFALGGFAPSGGIYGTLEGTPGVFVIARSVLDALGTVHLDHAALQVNRESVDRLSVTGPGPRRVELVRDGDRWHTVAGTPADGSRVADLLDRLAAVTVPRMFGYGPPPPEAHLGALTVEFARVGDAGRSTVRWSVGDRFGVGDNAGFYARTDGLDATLSLPVDLVEALQDYQP